MIRVLLVDDHPVVRAGLKAMLEDALPDQTDTIRVVAQAADGQGAIDQLARLQALGDGVDLVLMDLQMGAGLDGVSATRRIHGGEGGVRPVPVLVLTTYDSDADILGALEAGASGYMLKDAEAEKIRAAVRNASAGETALAPEVAARLVGRMLAPTESLTPREVELVELLAQGLPNRAIAKALFVSEATVKTHLVHIYQKLGVDNRTAAIAEASRRRIIRGH